MMLNSAIIAAALLFAGDGHETPITTLSLVGDARMRDGHTSVARVETLIQEGSWVDRDDLWDADDDFEIEPSLGQPWAVVWVDPGSQRFRWSWLPHRGIFRPAGRSMILLC